MHYKKFPIYLLVGTTSYLIEMGSLYFFNTIFGLSSVMAVAISFWIGFVVAFVLQKWFTFKSHNKKPRVISSQLIAYSILAIWNYGFTLLAVAMFSQTTSVFVIRTITIAIITLWNFAIYNIIFKEVLTKTAGSVKTRNRFKMPKSLILILSVSILLGLFWLIFVSHSQAVKNNQLISTHLPIGAKHTKATGLLAKPSSNIGCADGLTVMNIVAHQDDDLLFINPNITKHIDAGHCLITVYVTAGDAGRDSKYWMNRERGSQAAYSLLLGININEAWTEKAIKLADNVFVTEANPSGDKHVSLIYMRLPDGNVNGKGFGNSNYENIASLISGKIPTIHSVDGKSQYSSDQLMNAILSLMETYQPGEFNTTAQGDYIGAAGDHSDHVGVGRYVQRAISKYIVNHKDSTSVNYYIGYPIREKPENVSGSDLSRKIAAFVAYSQFDSEACPSVSLCKHRLDYWSYLHRQYTIKQW